MTWWHKEPGHIIDLFNLNVPVSTTQGWLFFHLPYLVTNWLLKGGSPEKGQKTLQWHHNGCDGVSNHQPYNYLLGRLFRHRSKKISKLRVTGLCERISPVTCEFPTQRASNAENVSIWWHHHDLKANEDLYAIKIDIILNIKLFIYWTESMLQNSLPSNL